MWADGKFSPFSNLKALWEGHTQTMLPFDLCSHRAAAGWGKTASQQVLLGEAGPAGSEGWGRPRMPLKAVTGQRSRDVVWGLAGGDSQSKDHRAFGGDTVKEPSFWVRLTPVCHVYLSKCKFPPPPEKGSSNRRQTLGSSLLPCFPRSGFTGKKCKKSDPKRFCYCCCAPTFPSLVNVLPESILFCPSFSFGNTCLCMCTLMYITCTHSYIYNCVQACADKT